MTGKTGPSTQEVTRDEERDRLLGHDYDGIREYDNPLPGWWVWIFVGTIAFSAGYFAYYQLGPGPTILSQYEEEVRLAAGQDASRVAGGGGEVTEESLRALQRNAPVMASAKEMFGARCAPCHGPEGQGLIGPNLTDEYWLHGGKLTEIFRTIADGVPDKGMLAWKGQLRPEELRAVTAFIGTLRGTHPPNPKPPQGTRVALELAGARPGR
jgi:cytochrome c oxidase cbb3-type subunit III